MFKKKKCSKCEKKLNDSFSYCPDCGKSTTSNKEEYGLLGRNDFPEIVSQSPFDSMFSGFTGNMVGKMLNSAMKSLDKEMRKVESSEARMPRTKFKLMINGKEVDLNSGKPANQKPKTLPVKQIPLPENTLKEFSTLPQETPKTNIRRLSDAVIYEIAMPGVKSEKDISIRDLGKSIEIRAVTKDKAYTKTLTLGLPVMSYTLDKETLILELAQKP